MIWSLFLLVDEELDVDLHQQYKDVGRQPPKALPNRTVGVFAARKKCGQAPRHVTSLFIYIYICIAGSMVEP